MNWHDVLPPVVATAQIAWERRQAALRMRALGMTFQRVGDRLGIGREGVRHMVARAQRDIARGLRSPVEMYFDHGGEIVALAEKINRRMAR